MYEAATKSTANSAPRTVYCRPTRTAPRPIIRRFGPSMTVVGPGAGLAVGLGTALGTALGACVTGVAPFFVSAGSLRNAMGASCVRVGVDALGAHVKKIVVRHERTYVQLVPEAAILVAVGGSDPGPVCRLLRRLHRVHVFKPEHAADQEPAERMEAFGDQQQPAIGRTHRLLPAHEGGEVHDAREYPADVRQAQIPGLGERNAGELRQRQHLPSVVELEQPVAATRLHAQA